MKQLYTDWDVIGDLDFFVSCIMHRTGVNRLIGEAVFNAMLVHGMIYYYDGEDL